MKYLILPLFTAITMTSLAYGGPEGGLSFNDLLRSDEKDTPRMRRIITIVEDDSLEETDSTSSWSSDSEEEDFDPEDVALLSFYHNHIMVIPQGITLRSVLNLHNRRELTIGALKTVQSDGSWTLEVPLTYRNGASSTFRFRKDLEWGNFDVSTCRKTINKILYSSAWLYDDEDMEERDCLVERVDDLPFGFHWPTVYAQLPAKPMGLSLTEQRNWTIRRFLQHFSTEGLTFQSNIPVGFQWREYWKRNPALKTRYMRENRLSEDPLGQLAEQKKVASWLHAIVKLSITGGGVGYSWVAGLPPDFNWKTFAKQNPGVEVRFRRENKLSPAGPITDPGMLLKRARWLQAIAKLSIEGKEAGYSWLPGIEKGFNWKAFAAQNPAVDARFRRENKLSRTGPIPDRLLAQRAAWLQAIVRGSITGNEAGHSWIAGLPQGFNWKAFAAQNPATDARFRRENKLSPIGPITDPGMLAQRARWLQVIAKLNMEGKDAGYSWLPGIEKGFNWKQALTPSVKSRYKREQLVKTQWAKASGKYSKTPKAYLTESDFNADDSLKPESGWLGKQAIWVQTIKKLGQI